MKKTLIIRSYEARDKVAVFKMVETLISSQLKSLSPENFLSDLRRVEEVYQKNKREGFWVAEVAGQVVGSIALKQDSPHHALLRRYFVAEQFQRKGIAKQLFETVVAFAKKNKYRKIIFSGNSEMDRMIKTLQALGFKEEEKIPLGPVTLFKSSYPL